MRIKRRDQNHTAICKRLELVGVSVYQIELEIDLIVSFRGQTSLLEIKCEDSGAEFKPSQLKLFSRWPAFIGYAVDFESAELLAKNPSKYALTAIEKDRIGQWLVRNEGKRLALNSFLKVIGR